MNEEEETTSGLSDLLRPDTTWEAYFEVKLEHDGDQLLEPEVSGVLGNWRSKKAL